MRKGHSYGLRCLGAHQSAPGSIRSDHVFVDEENGVFIMVDGGRSGHTTAIADTLQRHLRMIMENERLRLTEFGLDLEKNRPVIRALLSQYMTEALTAAEEEITKIGSELKDGVFAGLIVPVADIIFYAHYGTGRVYHEKRSASQILVLANEESGKKVNVTEIRLTRGDYILMTTDGFWRDNETIPYLLSEAAKKNPEEAFKRYPMAKATTEDRTAYLLWLDYPWHAASAKGLAHSAESISKSAIFKDLTFNEACSLLNVSKLRLAPLGQHLIKEGEPGNSLFVLLSGRVNVTNSSGIRRFREKPGETIGELAFFDGAPRTADVLPLEETELLEIPFAELLKLIQKEPVLGCKVLLALGRTCKSRLTETQRDLKQVRIAMSGGR